MKLKYLWIALCLLCTVFTLNAEAQMDNLANLSAEWQRLSNRNAATDAADIVVYNPAGLVDLSDGFHLNISNQFLFRSPEHTFTDPLGTGTLSYEQDSPDWWLPNLYGAYTKDKWSVYGGIYLPGASATIDYPDGSFTTRSIGAGLIGPGGQYLGAYTNVTNESLDATSQYISAVIGGAYQVIDSLSFSAGIRYVDAKNETDGNLTLSGGTMGDLTPDTALKVDSEQTAQGWGGVFGIQYKPIEKLNLAVHYETRVELDFKTELGGNDNLSEAIGLSVDGEKNRRDLSAMLGAGASYQITPELRGEIDFYYYFQKAADWGNIADGRDNSDLAGDVWAIGGALAYLINPKFEISGGFVYTKFDWGDIDAYYNNNVGTMETLFSNNWTLSGGFGYNILDNLKANVGVSYVIWDDETISTPIGDVETQNSTWMVGLGIDFSF
jgi:long-chain fatty acid transport protein